MASAYSFDVVSDFDYQELVNTVDQTTREINSRYDLKDTKTTVELGKEIITVNTDSEFTLDAVHTILRTKAAKRNLSQKIFDYGKVEQSSGNRVRQEIKLKKGAPRPQPRHSHFTQVVCAGGGNSFILLFGGKIVHPPRVFISINLFSRTWCWYRVI